MNAVAITAAAASTTDEQFMLSRIREYVSAADYASAVWWAERLRAQRACEQHNLVLAQCHLAAHSPTRAWGVLRHDSSPPNRYLRAVAAFQLDRLHDAELALLGEEGSLGATVPNGAAGLHLLGKILQRTSRKNAAIEQFRKSLQLDPCHWASFDALCRLGAVSPNQCGFYIPPEAYQQVSVTSRKTINSPVKPTSTVTALEFSPGFCTPQAQNQNQNQNRINFDVDTPLFHTDSTLTETPTCSGAQRMAPPPALRKVPSRPQRELRSTRRSERLSFSSLADNSDQAVSDRTIRNSARSRRSARLEQQKKTRAIIKTPAVSTFSTQTSSFVNATPSSFEIGDRQTHEEGSSHSNHSSTSPKPLDVVVKILAESHCLIHCYQCQEAISLLHTLPSLHFQTAFVLNSLGRAYFEMVKYSQAVEMFERARKLEPHRLASLEFYSTALWHLKRDVDLSYLAQQAVQENRLAPESWIVVGNCFSLQKEHETALKFFQRALQLDPNFAYAYTLCAHEYVANEDFDKALTGYRHAIRIDDRHYNAWYGLGNIYYRQEKYDFAAYHFQQAIKINERSSVLYCYLGMVLHANRHFEQALSMLNRSCTLQPSNLLPKFQKANVYFSLERYDMALAELQQVEDVAPREASVHLLMGKIYRKLGHMDKAMLHLTTCLDLDIKDKNLIKAMIDKLDAPHDDSQSEDDF